MISSNFIGMVMTGHNDDAAVVSAFARGEIFRIIPKPWNDAEFKTAVRQAFDYYTRLQRESDTVFYESYIARRS